MSDKASTPALPEQTLGPRLCLRPYQAADAPAVWEAIVESRAHLAPWLPWAEDYRSEDDVLDYLLRARAVWEQQVDLPLGIFRRADGRFLGGTGLHHVDWEQKFFEIGYWLRLSALGQGYARETVTLLTRLAFTTLGAGRVEVRVRQDNERSRRVPEALGFVLQPPDRAGEAREVDEETLVYALSPEQFRALRRGNPWRRPHGR